MYVLIGLFVFLLCYVLTPIVIRLGWRIGAVDVPLDGRRMHRRSIPRDGGIAIFLSFLFIYKFKIKIFYYWCFKYYYLQAPRSDQTKSVRTECD